VFSTKHRDALIPDPVVPKLHAYMVGILKDLDCTAIQIGGVADHVHALTTIGRTITIAQLTEELKKGSSKWMKTQGIEEFSWQAGYGAFSVSESKIPEVVEYIRHQAEHHRRRTFQEEYREFLVRHGIAFDERYVWD
jgi:REP element-mobilizing transposase RayT